ncbi:MAG TPA: hypothetical protein VE844_19570, partial [Gammaproteobacteria bacterium]|nr:hypothetical protein [Gammaproteobacteria bacterium]
ERHHRADLVTPAQNHPLAFCFRRCHGTHCTPGARPRPAPPTCSLEVVTAESRIRSERGLGSVDDGAAGAITAVV